VEIALMRHEVVVTDKAERDLDSIHDYIASNDSPAKAGRILDVLLDVVETLEKMPERGSRPRELAALGRTEYRQIVHAPWRFFYRVDGQRVFLVLIADGRRELGVGQDIGPNPPGQGAEITLHELPVLSEMGLTMTGPRQGGFGALNDRTNQICGKGDLICSAPEEAFSIFNLPKTLETLTGSAAGPVHALYNTPQFWVENGQTATQWTLSWTKDLVDNAPHPKHG